MIASAPPSRRWRRLPIHWRVRPSLEALEDRLTPASSILEPIANDTLVAAQLLEQLETTGSVQIEGAIGDNDFGGADVDAYTFVLTQATDLSLSGDHDGVVLSLYNSDPFNFVDQNYNSDRTDGHRLIAQSGVGDATLHIQLPPGSYYVVVSGEGNRWFSPLLADSGLLGQEGAYQLDLAATPLDLSGDYGPRVLYGTVTDGAQLTTSPHWIHLALSQDIDPSSYITIYDSNGNEWYSWWTNFSVNTHEIQMELINPLPIGDYSVVVIGFDGAILSVPFRVVGIEGGTGSDDTVDTAKDLGMIASGTSALLYGYVGDDSNYNLFLGDPYLADPTSDVDLVRFEVGGDGPQAVVIEAYAGRIGSPLQGGLALFSLKDGILTPVTSATGSGNTATTESGAMPLLSDPLMVLTLEPGVYVLAVTNNSNVVPDNSGFQYGMDGYFDPWTSHSGWNFGMSPGQYVLNITVAESAAQAPQVQSIQPVYADNGSLTGVNVQFNAYVNLPALATQGHGTIAPAYLIALDPISGDEVGARYVPILAQYDSATNTASLILQDYLSPGLYALHLSGAAGLTDLGGAPLEGNDAASGDYLEWIEIAGAERGTPVAVDAGHESLDDAQDIGPLFAHDLETGLTVERSANAGMNDDSDYLKFDVLQAGVYQFDAGAYQVDIYDANGWIGIASSLVDLGPGTYWLRVGSWDVSEADMAAYTLAITGVPQENPVPLSLGPAPAARLQIRPDPTLPSDSAPTPSIDSTPIVTLPAPSVASAPIVVNGGPSTPGPGTLLITLASIPRVVTSGVAGSGAPNGVLSGLANSPANAVPTPSSSAANIIIQAIENAFFLLDFDLQKVVENGAEEPSEDDEMLDPTPPAPEESDGGSPSADARQAPEFWVIPLETAPRACPQGSLGALAFFAGLLFAPLMTSHERYRDKKRSPSSSK